MRPLVIKLPLVAVAALALAGPALAQETGRATAYEQVAAWPDWSGVWSPGVGTGSHISVMSSASSSAANVSASSRPICLSGP